jgi:hypothetical protein
MADDGETSIRRRSRRTTFVDEETWAKFGALKAGITGRKGECAVAWCLRELGLPALHDVLLPDAHGVTQLDHVVRAVDGIVVIETKTYGGHITGTVTSAAWVQHLAAGEIRHAFQNPVHQNHRHCRAVEAALAGLTVPVAGIIVSAGAATFCDELQGRVVPLARLAGVFRVAPRRRTDPGHLAVAWQRLVGATEAAESRREEHREAVRRSRDGGAGTV